MSLPTYARYQATGADWLGDIPSHWRIKPLWTLFTRTKRVGHEQEELLSVYRDHGVVPKASRDDNNNKASDDLGLYQLVCPGDLAINKMKAWQGAVAISGHRGIVSPAYFIYEAKHSECSRYLHYLMRSLRYTTGYLSISKGIRINQWDLEPQYHSRLPVVLPPKDEQEAIAAFLDHETAKIDVLIAEQEKLLALLAEKRQATISHAVTRGLDPSVRMKDSGVAWLGEVPAHWEVIAIKQLSPVQRGASPRPIDDPKYFDDEGEYAWVRISDVSASGGLLQSTDQRLSELGASLSVKIEPGALFVSIAGTVGKPCIAGIKACIHDGFVYFPLLRIPAIFLFRVFEAGTCYAGLGKMGTQLNLNTDTIGSIRVALPPDKEMLEIVRFLERELERLDALQVSAQRTIALLNERRSALITAAVTGQIDVRDVSCGVVAA
jgi:type I restriction enzyme S subunit